MMSEMPTGFCRQGTNKFEKANVRLRHTLFSSFYLPEQFLNEDKIELISDIKLPIAKPSLSIVQITAI